MWCGEVRFGVLWCGVNVEVGCGVVGCIGWCVVLFVVV